MRCALRSRISIAFCGLPRPGRQSLSGFDTSAFCPGLAYRMPVIVIEETVSAVFCPPSPWGIPLRIRRIPEFRALLIALLHADGGGIADEGHGALALKCSIHLIVLLKSVSAFSTGQSQKLLVCLNALRHETAIPEQGVGGYRGRCALRGFPVRDVDDL